jgi:hypothetical protein
MKKLILTETQANKLIKKVIGEKYPDSDRFHIMVNCDFLYHGVTYKGGEIASIGQIQFPVTYNVDVEFRSYGIKGISVYNIQGPKTIDLEIDYYPPDRLDNHIDDMDLFKLQLDWDKLLTSTQNDTLGYFGVDEDLGIILSNDDQGNVIAKSIEVYTNNL